MIRCFSLPVESAGLVDALPFKRDNASPWLGLDDSCVTVGLIELWQGRLDVFQR
jgi:hypothetical protein